MASVHELVRIALIVAAIFFSAACRSGWERAYDVCHRSGGACHILDDGGAGLGEVVLGRAYGRVLFTRRVEEAGQRSEIWISRRFAVPDGWERKISDALDQQSAEQLLDRRKGFEAAFQSHQPVQGRSEEWMVGFQSAREVIGDGYLRFEGCILKPGGELRRDIDAWPVPQY